MNANATPSAVTATPRQKAKTHQRKRGRLTIVGVAGRRRGRAMVRCLCSCGKSLVAVRTNVLSGNTKSCGCLRREASVNNCRQRTTHGKSTSRVYFKWQSMVRRCHNPDHRGYPRYGGRGIRVCRRWRRSFEKFYADMGDPPPGLTLDRIDNNGNYEPGNCRWATAQQQSRNRRTSRMLFAFGETKCLTEWAEDARCVVTRAVLYRRIWNGWNPRKAITTP